LQSGDVAQMRAPPDFAFGTWAFACAASGYPVRFLNSAERNSLGRNGCKSMCRSAYNFVL
jgi:hypothetical protein